MPKTINWEEIRKEWETTNVTLAELAEKHSIKLGTLKSRKSREKWSRDPTKKDATKKEKVATAKKKVATPKQNKKNDEEPVIENDDLTDKQRLFCIYYVKYFNATKAYQKAYECDYFTAKTNGSRLLTNVNINLEIDRLKSEQMNGLKLDAQAILQKYIDIAFADITDFVEFGQRSEPTGLDGNGPEVPVNYVIFKNHDEVDGTIITEIKEGRDGVSIKLADKMKALDFLAKYTDLLSENDRKRLQDKKVIAETEFIQQRTQQIKGTQKDTSLLDALVEGRKQYEKMMKERGEKNE